MHKSVYPNHTYDLIFLVNQVQLMQGNVWSWRNRYERASNMGKQNRIPDVMHSNVGWSGQYLALSIHCIRKWRWCISNTVCDCFIHHRKADVLFGNVFGPIYEPEFGENLGDQSSISRYTSSLKWSRFWHIVQSLQLHMWNCRCRSRSNNRFRLCNHLLFLVGCINGVLLFCFIFVTIAMGTLSSRVGI